MNITVEQSGAFVEEFELPPTGEGVLAGLRFAVKDIIDIAGRKTGCGNPSWHDTHPPARSHAVCVEQLLAAGARCVGKTVSDEVAFSLTGENHFYGTPLNPCAPDRVPGGSSSGSASAVACGLVDFALGTDTGGSVRVPASNCGIWGLRPSHGFISVAGVMPFAPTFDTVGVHARNADLLANVAEVLLGDRPRSAVGKRGTTTDAVKPNAIYILRDTFELAQPEVAQSHQPALEFIRKTFGSVVRETSLAEIVGGEWKDSGGFNSWLETFYGVQWAEIENSLGPWIAASQPIFGPSTAKNFELVRSLDRRIVSRAIETREKYYRALRKFLGPTDLLCIPTAPAPAPLKGSVEQRTGDYYRRALSLTSIAGLCRLPQVSMPVSHVELDGREIPVGLSLIGAFGEDLFLMEVVRLLSAQFQRAAK
jgi:amidase